jgi:hypothetical protein
MLVGIYSTDNNIMDVINTFHIEKTQEGRKMKHKVMKVELARVDREEHEIRKNNPHSRNPKRVTFENEETPIEYFVEIGPNEVTTHFRKKNKQDKCKRAMDDDESIPIDYKEIIDLDETHLNHKRKKKMVDNVQEAIASSKFYSESSKGNREIITKGVDLEDGIIKTTQNAIRNRMRTKKLVDYGHTFQLNVKQIYKPTERKEKYQIRKPHHLYIHNLKALIRYNPYAHVVDYLVLVDPMEVTTREEFDRSKCRLQTLCDWRKSFCRG